jgi:hypothetical protein
MRMLSLKKAALKPRCEPGVTKLPWSSDQPATKRDKPIATSRQRLGLRQPSGAFLSSSRADFQSPSDA